MYVCMYVCYVCICMSVSVCTYVCMYVCLYLYVCICLYVRLYVCMYVRMYVCMYVCTCICLYMYMSVYDICVVLGTSHVWFYYTTSCYTIHWLTQGVSHSVPLSRRTLRASPADWQPRFQDPNLGVSPWVYRLL